MTPDEMREIASRIHESHPRPSLQDWLPTFASSMAIHAVADAFAALAEAISPASPPPREVFDIETARSDNAALGERIKTLKGAIQ